MLQMSEVFDFDNTKIQSEDDIRGYDRVPAGRYHVEVFEIDDTYEKSDKVIVDFRILAGTILAGYGEQLCGLGQTVHSVSQEAASAGEGRTDQTTAPLSRQLSGKGGQGRSPRIRFD
jgi:hypothetical protein